MTQVDIHVKGDVFSDLVGNGDKEGEAIGLENDLVEETQKIF